MMESSGIEGLGSYGPLTLCNLCKPYNPKSYTLSVVACHPRLGVLASPQQSVSRV